MKVRSDQDYEALRAWGRHEDLTRPPGLAQFLRFGLATWLRLMGQSLPSPATAPLRGQEGTTDAAPSLLVGILATMLREVQR